MGQKRIFISHSWRSANITDYTSIKRLLENRSYFSYYDYSVDSTSPLAGDVWNQIDNKIKNANVFIITAGVYASYSESIQREISIAVKYNKRILAVKPYGNINISSYVSAYADEIVNHNTESIVSAIRRLS